MVKSARSSRAIVLGIGLAVLQSCASSSVSRSPLELEEGCQPLVGKDACWLPYPSDFYLEPDPTQRTGKRVAMKGAARPKSWDGKDADVLGVWRADGFSRQATIVAHLPGGELSREGLPNLLDDGAASARADAATVIVEAESGAFVAHYTDVDLRARNLDRQAIVMHAFAPLKAKTRYVVALQGVRLASGELAKPHEPFRRLRDRQTESDPALLALAPRFDREVFAVLDRVGVRRETLQLAWDFTTGSEEQPVEDMLRVRELALAELAKAPPTVTITAENPSDDPRIYRNVRGTVTGPMFLESTDPRARLVRGPDGKPALNGNVSFDFYASIPASARAASTPARAVAFGHGFFGSTGELDGNGARTIASTLGVIEFGIDWWGMSKVDYPVVADTIAEAPTLLPSFTDRVHQAMANWLTMTAAIRGPLAATPAFSRSPGVPLYDPSSVFYFGASQGHILGGTLAALSPDIDRFVLNVGGGALTHMMPRALPFAGFFLVIDAMTHDDLLSQAMVAIMQSPLDRIDPAAYAPFVFEKKWPGSPSDRRLLMQIGLGDAQVPNLGSFFHARSLGLRMTTPSPLSPFLIEPSAPEGLSSALTLYDFGIDTRNYAKVGPLADNLVHEGVRVNPAALRQMDAFWRRDSKIIHPCDGKCDPQ
jgi:hypothetical protein